MSAARAFPVAVRGPVDLPPCSLHRLPRNSFLHWQGVPRRVRAPHTGLSVTPALKISQCCNRSGTSPLTSAFASLKVESISRIARRAATVCRPRAVERRIAPFPPRSRFKISEESLARSVVSLASRVPTSPVVTARYCCGRRCANPLFRGDRAYFPLVFFSGLIANGLAARRSVPT